MTPTSTQWITMKTEGQHGREQSVTTSGILVVTVSTGFELKHGKNMKKLSQVMAPSSRNC